jgi:molybdopterin-guanine dinucleotide biosynthesis protein A
MRPTVPSADLTRAAAPDHSAGETVAIVLAGGDGRRMGGSKPLRRIGTTTLVANAADLARAYCPTVAVAVRSLDQLGLGVKAEQVIDLPGFEGPLAGLAAGLHFAQQRGAERVLTLPCDAPRLPADLRDRLEAALGADGPAQVAVASSGGRLHPTCGLWRSSALGALRAYAEKGGRSLTGLAGELCMTIVEWDAGDADPFANANTPEELAALQPNTDSLGYSAIISAVDRQARSPLET